MEINAEKIAISPTQKLTGDLSAAGWPTALMAAHMEPRLSKIFINNEATTEQNYL